MLPKDYKLFQAADLICTLTLLELKCESGQLTRSEELIFHTIRRLKKDFIDNDSCAFNLQRILCSRMPVKERMELNTLRVMKRIVEKVAAMMPEGFYKDTLKAALEGKDVLEYLGKMQIRGRENRKAYRG